MVGACLFGFLVLSPYHLRPLQVTQGTSTSLSLLPRSSTSCHRVAVFRLPHRMFSCTSIVSFYWDSTVSQAHTRASASIIANIKYSPVIQRLPVIQRSPPTTTPQDWFTRARLALRHQVLTRALQQAFCCHVRILLDRLARSNNAQLNFLCTLLLS